MELVAAVRKAASERAWAKAVDLARAGAVQGVHDDGDEVFLRVKAHGRALPYEVYLWPVELEWECTCDLPGEACLHVCAAAIGLSQSRAAGQALPEPQKTYKAQLSYVFRSVAKELAVERALLLPGAPPRTLTAPLSEANVLVDLRHAHAELVLVEFGERPLTPDALRRLLALLDGEEVTLDGAPVRLSAEPVHFRVRVADDGDGFAVRLVSPAVDALYRGAARVGDVLRPTAHGELTPEQRRALASGVRFGPDEVARLVGSYLVRLRERIEVDVDTARLPRPDALRPRVAVELRAVPDGLQVTTRLVYGDPPVARIDGNVVTLFGEVVPARDPNAERLARRSFEERTGLFVGPAVVLAPERAADLLKRLEGYEGPIEGDRSVDRFRVLPGALRPHLQVAPAGGGWRFSLEFSAPEGVAPDAHAVVSAWSLGKSLVPLMGGGFARLPKDWLERHGAIVAELLESRDRNGVVDRHATAALVELLEETEADVPADLQKLHAFLSGAVGMEEVEPSPAFRGDLRPYQRAGISWLGFLERTDLHGILADDMGLGKTVQALAALSRVDGPHLVVAPTSVLPNWEREIRRFLPDASVAVYHGPDRTLGEADFTLTTYALLRIDTDRLCERTWTYVVLDEAQAIKNPDSQTARAAYRLRGHHRLCMTGTPVENRLEELWSQFRFLMPGLLGSRTAFRERFERPIEAGDTGAKRMLRARTRPYVLRRTKSQVASELPPLTEMVIRCELPVAQRRVYDAVRAAALCDLGPDLDPMHVLTALLRLRQACCDPALLGAGGENAPAAKLDQLEELLVDLVCDDHKALVFSQWTGLLDRVEPRLRHLGIGFVRLDGSTRDRAAVVDAFQASDGPPVFLVSLKAGGTGLNLTAADYVVHLDPWWNPAVEQQATDRAHRIGQERPVVSCRLIAADTVEERVLELQEAKRGLAEAALGVEGGMLRALSAAELRRLFE